MCTLLGPELPYTPQDELTVFIIPMLIIIPGISICKLERVTGIEPATTNLEG